MPAYPGTVFMNVLVIEDEIRVAAIIEEGLRAQGFAVTVRHNGSDGLAVARVDNHDVIILDLMIPGIDGLSLLSQLRATGCKTPILVLSALDAVQDRIRGLDLGADDYLTKPFYVDELVARLRALVRRQVMESPEPLQVGCLTINPMRREVHVGAQRIELTPREYNLLEYLARSAGVVLTRPQILERVWEYHFDPQTNIVDVYIQKLRARLAEAGAADLIETVRGVGYRMMDTNAGTVR